jgi:hypothetical protein
LTSTQVANDAQNVAAALAHDHAIDKVPWFWTLGGDNILSLDTGKQPLGVVGGVPGTMPAITEVQGNLSSSWATITSIALSNFPSTIPLKLSDFLIDVSTTAGAGDYGGQHLTVTVNASDVLIGSGSVSVNATRKFETAEIYMMARLYGSAATPVNIYTTWLTGGRISNSDTRQITPAITSYRLFHSKSNIIRTTMQLFSGATVSAMGVQLYASKVSSNVDITVDYFAIVPRPVLFLTGGVSAVTGFYYKKVTASEFDTSTVQVDAALNVTGDVIEFSPDVFNHLQCYFCPDETVDPAITYQCTLSTIYLTPRWPIL